MRNWGPSESDVRKITSHSTSTKQRRWSWTSGNSRGSTPPPSIQIDGTVVEKVESFKFLGVHITDKLKLTAWWRRRNSASSNSGGWRNLACHLNHSQTFTDEQSRGSCQAASQPSMETAPPLTTRLSRGWCGLHNASPGANNLPSMTPTAPDVTRRPRRSSKTSTTWATAYSHRYHPEGGEVSTGASKLGPRDWKTASISRPSDCNH